MDLKTLFFVVMTLGLGHAYLTSNPLQDLNDALTMENGPNVMEKLIKHIRDRSRRNIEADSDGPSKLSEEAKEEIIEDEEELELLMTPVTEDFVKPKENVPEKSLSMEELAKTVGKVILSYNQEFFESKAYSESKLNLGWMNSDTKYENKMFKMGLIESLNLLKIFAQCVNETLPKVEGKSLKFEECNCKEKTSEYTEEDVEEVKDLLGDDASLFLKEDLFSDSLSHSGKPREPSIEKEILTSEAASMKLENMELIKDSDAELTSEQMETPIDDYLDYI